MPIVIEGAKEVLTGLSKIDEDLRRRIVFAITPMMRNVATKAKGYVPNNSEVLSGWSKPISSTNLKYKPFPKYDADVARAGIGYNPGENKTFTNGWKVANYVYNASRPGAIYEVAGRLNPQGRAPFEFRTSKGDGGTYTLRSPKSKALEEFGSNNPFASAQFIAALPKVTSQPKIKDIRGGGRKTKGRLIYRAWAEDSPKIYEMVIRQIKAVSDNFNKSTEITKKAA
jgi:hypothetical protein